MKPKKIKGERKYRPLVERWTSDGDMSDAFTVGNGKGDELTSNNKGVQHIEVAQEVDDTDGGGDMFGGMDENNLP